MRIITHLARRRAHLLIAAIGMVMPLYVNAQLNLETQKLILQGSTSGGLTLQVPAAVTSYSLTLPAAAPATGSLLYQGSSGMQWSGGAVAGYVLTTDGTTVSWVDPASATSPNWSLAGNSTSSAWNGTTGSYLGTRSTQPLVFATTNATAQAIQFWTGNNGSTEAMRITGTGLVGVGTSSPTAKLTVAGTLTQSDGQVTLGGNVDATNGLDVTNANLTVGGTNFVVSQATGNTVIAGTLAVTGAASLGDVNLNGTTNDLQMNGSSGTSGQVLVSGGANVTPAWTSIGSALGIRAAGVVAVTAAIETSVINATGLEATDAIVVTMQSGGASTVIGTVTNRNDATDTFIVRFSAAFTGSVNYLVIKTF